MSKHPVIAEIKGELLRTGAVFAQMSGSGPTVFGIYLRAPEFHGDRVLERQDWKIEMVRPVVLPIRQ
jgi:4-diphosphocytidyl-2C-methyl-D-erythritol kinase